MRAKQINKFVKDWILPRAYWRFVRKPDPEWILTAQEAALLARNAQFHNMYLGRRCFVIGNGPSINKQDLTPLSGEITITMNWFNRHPILDIWKPTFHCIAEPGSATGWTVPNLLPRYLDRLDPQAYFVRSDTKAHFERINFLNINRVHFLKMAGWASPERTIDLSKPIPKAPDASVLATMIAIALGCSPIYLLGLDYDWLTHRSLNRHFYDVLDPADTPEDLSTVSYLQDMKQSQYCWISHEALRENALRRGQRIYNATEGSFLDVYPTARLSEVLEAKADQDHNFHQMPQSHSEQ